MTASCPPAGGVDCLPPPLEAWLWRHPRPVGAAGRCIGQTDLGLDARRAKRLAHQIRSAARRHGLPRVVWTSPLRRCANVGRQLARWGWVHRIDARLLELDFGRWDGLGWPAIGHAEVAAWEADFAHHAPGGGESLAALQARSRHFADQRVVEGSRHLLVVAHAGWINASAVADLASLQPAAWPAAPGYGSLTRRSWPAPAGRASAPAAGPSRLNQA